MPYNMHQFYIIQKLSVDNYKYFCNSRSSGKREPVITKPEYYMTVAKLSELRSKDGKIQVYQKDYMSQNKLICKIYE